ncbi:MAG: thermonuclease family protein [Fusobacteriaceae bacterium]|nr:thermonuclease family protein [Fusobacteriaceae bacterium]
MSTHRIVIGDSRKLSGVPDKSVQLIITSPPYWQLKDYGSETQIGFNDSYEEYINNLNLVWKECDRVLSDGCRMCINIGDQFARSVYYARYKVIPIRTEIIRFCETLGMDYMGAIIWQKTTTMNTSGGGAIMGSFPFPRNGILKMDYEFILLFKKLGKAPQPTIEQKKMSEMTKEEWSLYFSSHWHFNGAKQSGHMAMFPEELPKRLIKMFSFVGETVFDPFLGSGTTTLAARNLGRNSVGYEINEAFLPAIKEKIGAAQPLLPGDTFLFDVEEKKERPSFEELPYIFSDPHKMDKKIDVKKLTFGSRLDESTEKREEYFSVSRIISPDSLVLNNGLQVKLIGVKVLPDTATEATEFLRSKFHKRKVFLKFDQEAKYDAENRLLCYLYLDNKTFINRHLIQTGYVDVDLSYDYQYKKKFLNSSPLD